ncbi:MAG: peptide chain release factor-like protein [Desulfobacteraceae bacterium 4572_123]|nr:MAG: peptide chain release factor-like protein [Desulfobacteraceae bacterium 4572_123]
MGPGKNKIDALEKKMKVLNINKKDIQFKYIKASGRGGQKVNKSSSAVFAKHIKTGISVKCGKARSQHLNKFLALRNLVDKIEVHIKGIDIKKISAIEKIRKQKSKRKHVKALFYNSDS